MLRARRGSYLVGDGYVGRLRTFLAHGHVKGDLLALNEGTATAAIDCGVVDEDVLIPFPLNEAETLLVVEPLHNASHLLIQDRSSFSESGARAPLVTVSDAFCRTL